MFGIIIVIYKSHEQTASYVTRQLPKIALEHRTVIVDLASDVDVSQALAERIGAVWTENGSDGVPVAPLYVLHTPENMGYARGNNLGAKFLLNIDCETDKLLVSNDDIEFISDNVVDVLAERLDAMPDCGCIWPCVHDLNGHFQGPGYSRSAWEGKPEIGCTIRRNFGEPLFGATRYELKMDGEPPSGRVCLPNGCFMMLRTSDFVAAGMFDERTFLYWEEAILSARLCSVGKSVYYESSVKILHYVGNTTSKHAPNLLLLKCELAGQRLYFSDYSKAGVARRMFLRLSAFCRMTLVRLCVLKRNLLGQK